jgi:hypothetical protein
MGAYYVIERGDVLRARAISVHVTARVISPLCGNGVIDSGEQCDGTNLNNQTCAAFGYTSGNVSCNSDCTLNTSGCFTPPPPGGGGGGGGGGVPSSVTQVTFRGVAYPGSPVILLRDGQQIARVNAGPDARFELGVSGLAGGSYTFMVYAQDNNGIRSALNAFTADITNGVSTVVSGIVISPTIATDKSQVKQGDPLMVFGAAAPSSTIGLTIHSNQTITSTLMTGSDGTYVKMIDSSLLLRGDHSAMAKTSLNDPSGLQSPYSAVTFFKVGDTNIYAPTGGCMRADLNCDGKVNLVDFSILAYWYHRPLTNEAVGAGVDLSADGKIDLTDFSIMAYYWTG